VNDTGRAIRRTRPRTSGELAHSGTFEEAEAGEERASKRERLIEWLRRHLPGEDPELALVAASSLRFGLGRSPTAAEIHSRLVATGRARSLLDREHDERTPA
jgi:hypothetical protein